MAERDGRPFLDTNVLLYLLSGDAPKADKAEALLAGRGIVSVQVLNELASVAVRKLGLTWRELGELIAAVRARCEVHSLTEEVHDQARELAERYRLSFYDAAIVSSALIAGCRVLYSEDMQHGLKIDRSLTIRNPFVR
ncbi:MAG: PIN domain-containing protein [Gammaproteobacteria bacterium]